MDFQPSAYCGRVSPPRLKFISWLFDRALPEIEAGHLQLVLPNGHVIERQGAKPGPDARMEILNWRALSRMLVQGEHGFADAYLAGHWTTPDLRQLLEFWMHNDTNVMEQSSGSWVSRLRNKAIHSVRTNTRRGSKNNIAAHYDLGNAFYKRWLDQGMNYSSGIYEGAESLEDAQEAKLKRIADLLDLSGEEKVLEIGCGWGALLERLARQHGCSVTGITLSEEQLVFAQARLAKDVGNGAAEVRLQDYRDVSERYDRIASIEMIEAVGERYWTTYFNKIRGSLKQGGTVVLQAITIDEKRYETYRAQPDFIQRHIFPGGMLPTVAIMESIAKRAGLSLVHQETFPDSYARTLEEWRNRFLAAWSEIEPLGFDQRFRRMWEYYLTYCEVGFRFRAINVGLFKFAG